MRKTLFVLAIIAALSSSAFAATSATLEGGTSQLSGMWYIYTGNGNVTIADGSEVDIKAVIGQGSSTDNISGATVTMTGGTIDGEVLGGSSGAGSATNNTVTISGGTVTSNVKGGDSAMADANNNTVTISGGAVQGNVYGGSSVSGNASNNTVNLVGEGATLGELTGSSFTIGGSVYGGEGGASSVCTGNTLNIYGKGITVTGVMGGVGNFQTVNFYLASGTQNGDTILTTTMFGTPKLNVKCNGDTQLNEGDTVTLVHTTTAVAPYVGTSEVDVIQGVSATYSGKVAVKGADVVLTIGDDATTNDEALKSMTETRTDVAALVNSAADFMATTGVQQAKLAAKVAALAGKDGAAPFMAMGGSSMRYNTGSHVDANGFNGALGVAKAFDDITLGVAGEYGLSSYRSHVGSTSAKGDSKLYGGALLADWQDKQGWHAEGAVRLGRTSTDYSAMTALGHTHYTDHASYQGALIGGGKEFKVSRKSDDTVDLYARYMYTHTNASNTKATSGESMHFAGVDSHRTMVGARYNHELTDTAVVYAGAAWMHEFNGDAHSVIGGFTSPSPSLEGDSGMVEIGTTFAPCRSESILLNLNVQGWTGVQRGISGGAGCTIKF